MQKLTLTMLGICGTLFLTGAAIAEPAPLASTWIKLDTTQVKQHVPYNAYAYSYSMLDRGAYCGEDKTETCQIIKLAATPLTKSGKIEAVLFYYVENAVCQAVFDVPFKINNNAIVAANGSYTAKWTPQEGTNTSQNACPANTLTLTASPLNEQDANGYKGYELKVIEN